MATAYVPALLLLCAVAAFLTGLYALGLARRREHARVAAQHTTLARHAVDHARHTDACAHAEACLGRLYERQRAALHVLVAHGRAVVVPPLPPVPTRPALPHRSPDTTPPLRWALAGVGGALAAAGLLWWAARTWGVYPTGEPFADAARQVRDASVWAWLGGGPVGQGGGGGTWGRLVVAAWAVGMGTLAAGLSALPPETAPQALLGDGAPAPADALPATALATEAHDRTAALDEALAALGEADRRADPALGAAATEALARLLHLPLRLS